jgi:hypothetical protein
MFKIRNVHKFSVSKHLQEDQALLREQKKGYQITYQIISLCRCPSLENHKIEKSLNPKLTNKIDFQEIHSEDLNSIKQGQGSVVGVDISGLHSYGSEREFVYLCG